MSLQGSQEGTCIPILGRGWGSSSASGLWVALSFLHELSSDREASMCDHEGEVNPTAAAVAFGAPAAAAGPGSGAVGLGELHPALLQLAPQRAL